jgi:hypothetical protein
LLFDDQLSDSEIRVSIICGEYVIQKHHRNLGRGGSAGGRRGFRIAAEFWGYQDGLGQSQIIPREASEIGKYVCFDGSLAPTSGRPIPL